MVVNPIVADGVIETVSPGIDVCSHDQARTEGTS